MQSAFIGTIWTFYIQREKRIGKSGDIVFFCYTGASFDRLDEPMEIILTHTVTHTGKRACGNSGDKTARNYLIVSGKAPKASEISAFEALTTLRNQQVMCSNHTTSSKLRIERCGAFLSSSLKTGSLASYFFSRGEKLPIQQSPDRTGTDIEGDEKDV